MRAIFRTKRFWAATLAVLLAGLALPLLTPVPKAAAHPLGNFTINRYSRLEIGPSEVRLRYVLDMAEIPAFQERGRIDKDGDGGISDAERERYLVVKVEQLRRDLDLKVGGFQIDLTAAQSNVSFPEGQGGLNTERIEIDFSGRLSESASKSLEYHDNTYRDRIGWQEVVMRALPGVRLESSTAPTEDVSDELRSYPTDGGSSPLNYSSATASFSIVPGAPGQVDPPRIEEHGQAVRGNQDAPLAAYADLVSKDELSFGVIALALLAAVGFGAIHALSPGHGKTIVGAYLVGSRGTWRHALLLALVVTITHTSSVYALGFVTLYLSQYIVPEDLYPLLGIVSGGLIVAMGAGLVVARLRTSGFMSSLASWLNMRPRLALGSEQGAIALAVFSAEHAHHEHDQSADHHHGHTHALPGRDGEAVSWRSLIGLGIFGGLLPCPSAIVVMLSAIALHRVAFGLVLILAFSVGLALVLTAIGFALVFGGTIAARLPIVASVRQRVSDGSRLSPVIVRLFPSISAAAVLVAGLVVLMRALVQQGVV